MKKATTIYAYSVGTLESTTKAVKPYSEVIEVLTNVGSIQDRFMKLSSIEINKEGDFIASFNNMTNRGYVFGSLLRMKEGEVTHIMKSQMNKSELSLDEISQTNEDNIAGTVKDYSYFLLSNDLLILAPFGLNIKAFQSYINWLTRNKSAVKVGFNFSPKTRKVDGVEFSDITGIKISETFFKGKSEYNNIFKQLNILKSDVIKSLLANTRDLKDIEEERIISAKILLKIRGSKDAKKTNAKKQLTAVLKSVDHDDIEITSKGGRKVKGNEFVMKKAIPIETTSNNNPVEAFLEEKMYEFAIEVRDDENSH